MYGDTTVIRRLARDMDERAIDLRAQARSLGAAADATTWVSVAGSRMRERVAERAADIEDTAGSYEDAAAKLRRHADEVDELKALIGRIEDAVTGLISGAVDRLRDAGHAIVDAGRKVVGFLTGGDSEPDPEDLRLAGYQTPPPGDKAWLDVPDDIPVPR